MTPPAIAQSTPEGGAINVDVEEVRIRFSEYVNQSTFTDAFSISPPFDEPIDFDWSGRTVVIDFPQPLRDNTTYVITLDNSLTDDRGVALEQPIVLAFSTGPTINQGRIAGRVVDATTGEGAPDYHVYAYVLPDSTAPSSLPDRPHYRTQTGVDGQFELTYLSEQPFYVIALQDLNRDRRPDPLEPFAVPPVPALAADTAGTALEAPWLAAVLDTVPPEPLRAQALTPRRLSVRFSEDVRLVRHTVEAWQLYHEEDAADVDIEAVYTRASEPAVVYLRTDSLHPAAHALRITGIVADTSGNVAADTTLRFTPGPSLPPDTLGTRFEAFLPDQAQLLPGESPAVRFNLPLDSARLHAVVAVGDSAGAPRPFVAHTQDGTTHRLVLQPPLAPGDSAVVAVDATALNGRDTTFTRAYTRLGTDHLGSLSGYVAMPEGKGTTYVELYRSGETESLRRQPTDTTGRFHFQNLSEGRYWFRAFLDENANRRWDPGRILPYAGPEPVTWSRDSTRVRPRWEDELADTLRF